MDQSALFFGVEMLLSQCWLWLSEVTSSKVSLPPQLQLDALIHIWKYGLEHGKEHLWCLATVEMTNAYNFS